LVAEHHAGTVSSGRDIVAPVEDAVVEIWGCPDFVLPKMLVVCGKDGCIVCCVASFSFCFGIVSERWGGAEL